MSNSNSSEPELQFPLTAPFRVIAEETLFDHSQLETALAAFTLVEKLAPSHASTGGKYVSFGFSARVNSREELRLIDARVRQVAGVKMVL